MRNANADGRRGTADAELVWRRFSKEGCSLRLLHPQRWHDELWRTLAPLEAFFGCAMGCNAYLTPAGSQVMTNTCALARLELYAFFKNTL